MNPLITFLAAYGLAKIYEKLPYHIQQEIKQVFNLHHGTIGCLSIILGIITKNAHLIASGEALAIHDRKDAPLWKIDIEKIVNSFKQKINNILEESRNQVYYPTQNRFYLQKRY